MEAVGVDRALIDALPRPVHTLPDGTRRFSNSYAEGAAERYPGIFVSTTKYDPGAADIEDLVAATRSAPGVLAIRAPIVSEDDARALKSGGYDRMLEAAQHHDVPMMFFISAYLELADTIARRFPKLQIIVDHYGMPQPPLRERDDPPFRALSVLLGLAECPNIAVKLIGAPALSLQPYPYRDTWEPTRKIIDEFGPERLMWGSDLTRFRGMFPYADLLSFVKHGEWLSDEEKEWLFGKALRSVMRWPMHQPNN